VRSLAVQGNSEIVLRHRKTHGRVDATMRICGTGMKIRGVPSAPVKSRMDTQPQCRSSLLLRSISANSVLTIVMRNSDLSSRAHHAKSHREGKSPSDTQIASSSRLSTPSMGSGPGVCDEAQLVRISSILHPRSCVEYPVDGHQIGDRLRQSPPWEGLSPTIRAATA